MEIENVVSCLIYHPRRIQGRGGYVVVVEIKSRTRVVGIGTNNEQIHNIIMYLL